MADGGRERAAVTRGGSDIRSLQGQIRDLAALLALPAVWRGREVPFIAGSLLDALLSLLRVDIAYIRLERTSGEEELEDRRPLSAAPASEIGAALEHWRDPARTPATSLELVPGGGMMHVMRIHPRTQRGRAVVMLCSARPDFPTDVESFLLRTAVDQGMVALEGSRLLRELKEANEAKAAFLATMSHELRTPLNAILGYVDLLDAGVAGELNERQKQNLSRVRAGSLHLQELIEGILSFARIDAGKERVYRAPVELCELVRETAVLVEPLALARDLQFTTRIPADPITITTDAAKVRQILLNLLSNAVKFTESGSVMVEVRRTGGGVELAVSDTGVGIPPEEQERIFEPFRQVGDVYTQKSTGSGLGLSVSRQLARLLGGDVTVASTFPGGSTFTLALPDTERPVREARAP